MAGLLVQSVQGSRLVRELFRDGVEEGRKNEGGKNASFQHARQYPLLPSLIVAGFSAQTVQRSRVVRELFGDCEEEEDRGREEGRYASFQHA